jgi:hypothetical protein
LRVFLLLLLLLLLLPPPPAPPLGAPQNSSVGAYTSRGFVEVLAASQSNVRKEWFQGTADAVRQYMWLFEEAMRDGVQDFLILSGVCVVVGGGAGCD